MALPIDLVAGILRRLPAKSLVRFRCLSKEWSYLCFEPYFAKLRHQNHPDRKLIARDGLLCSLDLGSLDRAHRLDYLQNPNSTVKKLWGCSNGKICFSVANPVADTKDPVPETDIPPAELTGDTIVISDLSTGAGRIVLPSPVDFQVESWDEAPLRAVPFALEGHLNLGIIPELNPTLWVQRHISYGFGFDPSGEDYKLVRISQYITTVSSHGIHYLLSEAMVYSMKTNSWSRVSSQDMSSFYINDTKEPVLVDGVLYWVAAGFHITVDRRKSCRELIVAFNLAEESFRGIAPKKKGLGLLCLGSMGGKLCVLGCDSRSVKLWKVEDHGGVWTPWASFAGEVLNPRSCSIEAMTFSKNGDKVLLDNVCCDLAEGTAGMCYLVKKGKPLVLE